MSDTPAGFACCPGRIKHYLLWQMGSGSICECYWRCLFCDRTFSVSCIERHEPVWAETVNRTKGEHDQGTSRVPIPLEPVELQPTQDPAGPVSEDPKSQTSHELQSEEHHKQGSS